MDIFEACRSGDVYYLLAAIERGEDVNEVNEDNWTPLMYAICHSSEDNLECMRTLINHGANVNGRDNNQSTALHYAATYNNIDGINLLLDNGAEIDPVNSYNETPLMLTCRYNDDINSTRVLLERGANLTIPDSDGDTCLHCATTNLNIDMIKLLFEYGADDAIVNVCKPFYFFCYNNNKIQYYV